MYVFAYNCTTLHMHNGSFSWVGSMGLQMINGCVWVGFAWSHVGIACVGPGYEYAWVRPGRICPDLTSVA